LEYEFLTRGLINYERRRNSQNYWRVKSSS
jgi:hypothetical protein